MYELLGERTAADNEKPVKKKEKKEKPAKVEVSVANLMVFLNGLNCEFICFHICVLIFGKEGSCGSCFEAI